VKIEDVLHNIISRKTLTRPKEMNAVSTKVLLRFFPPVCTFAASIFSQVIPRHVLHSYNTERFALVASLPTSERFPNWPLEFQFTVLSPLGSSLYLFQ
jgi:hypothetical protein